MGEGETGRGGGEQAINLVTVLFVVSIIEEVKNTRSSNLHSHVYPQGMIYSAAFLEFCCVSSQTSGNITSNGQFKERDSVPRLAYGKGKSREEHWIRQSLALLAATTKGTESSNATLVPGSV